MPVATSRDLGSHCIAAGFLDGTPWFALADGSIHRWAEKESPLQVHRGLLAAAQTDDGLAVLSSGEDGRVCRTGASGAALEFACVPRKWITAVASSVHEDVAYVCGSSVWIVAANSKRRQLQHPRSIEAIAFSPDGRTLGVAGYDGVRLHELADPGRTIAFEAKGLGVGLTFSPDGRFVVTRMKEGLVRAWCVSSCRGMHMSGYPGAVEDWAWSADGKWLVTSGAMAAVAWPFDGADGPMGRAALELGEPSASRVAAVACHPSRDWVAMGHADGQIQLARIDSAEQVSLGLRSRGAITSIAWHPDGSRIAFGSAPGECGVLEVPIRGDAAKEITP